MELKYVLITLLKILISTPTILLLYDLPGSKGAALMGGHLDNKKNHSTNFTDNYYEYDDEEIVDSQELDEKQVIHTPKNENPKSEEMPDPSPLVLPGYNLPDNIFNHGKPFYVEKDPLTGKIDFSHKSSSPKLEDDLYEYVDEEPSENIYNKANIDRKDGGLGSHKPNDVNQLTPNFHDFLNLPVKYNPDKYVYPLISSSYASTKIQGSVNKFHNHKEYGTKTTTKKPMLNPTYFSTNQYFNPAKTTTRILTTTTTTQKPSTIKRYPEIYLTTESTNLMESGMSHPSFSEDFDYYDVPSTTTTEKPKLNDIYFTTESLKNPSTKAPSTTTTKIMSLFEQLFGDFDDMATTTQKTKLTTTNDYITKPDDNKTDELPSTTQPSTTDQTNGHGGPNILTDSHMGLDTAYEYDDYGNGHYDDNIAVESKPVKNVDDDLRIEPLDVFKEEPQVFNLTKVINHNNIVHITTTTTEKQDNIYENKYQQRDTTTKITTTTTTSTTTTPTTAKPTTTTSTKPTTVNPSMPSVKVTSLPLGENHVTNSNYDLFNREPIIVATQNLREKLNSEKVLPRPFEKPPSTSNIHIAPDQDTVSFVVGNHQNVEGDGQYVGTSLKESPYESNPFRPLYGQQSASHNEKNSVSFSVQPEAPATLQSQPTHLIQSYPEPVGSAVTIQPFKNSEASLAIGVPVNSVKQKPGQVVDEMLKIENESIEPPKSSGSKIVFPNEKEPEFPDLVPPPRHPLPVQSPPPNREVLKLSSKPVYHQLPSDLTPPKQNENIPSLRPDHRPVRPPWDPRPGHFYSGKPEYNRPPRPTPELAYKRMDNLPNILPQFRPNTNKRHPPVGHFYDNRLVRQPLLERPSNRPIGLYENMQPPPPPFPPLKNIQHLRKIPPPTPPRQSLDEPVAEDRIINEGSRKPIQSQVQFEYLQTPPAVKIANRRNGDDTSEVETLQMIQAKNTEKSDKPDQSSPASQVVNIPAEDTFKDNTEKTIYKVYPVNTPPIKLDAIDNEKPESVVIGHRAELPLPPSKINKDFVYNQNPIFELKDRNDAPILKPHIRPMFPIRSDFPYPLERPDPSVIHPAVPETPSNSGNGLDDISNNYADEYFSGNQWGTNIESRIVNKQNVHSPNQISVTLKTITDKPIAVAYTPTEPNLNADKYSMPNYGSPVIPEIRPGTVENVETGPSGSNSEYTVSAVMHTHPQLALGVIKNIPNETNKRMDEVSHISNHKSDMDMPDYPKLEFQAPFQASVNLDQTINQGWSVVKEKNKTTSEEMSPTTMPYATASEFDIENFKPQLEGGFKPIYNFPDSEKKVSEIKMSEREE